MDKRREWTVRDLVTFLDTWFPPGLAEAWDNVGLLLGDPGAAVRKVMTCLTVTPASAAEACAAGADMIITHHPILFRPVKRLTADGAGAYLYHLAREGISVYSPHTSFDGAACGINEQIAQRLQLRDVRPLRPLDDTQPSIGSGRHGSLPDPVPLAELASRVRCALASKNTSYIGAANQSCQRVAIGCGAGMEFLADAIKHECDTLITGEARFHQFLEAEEAGIALLLAGHYATERFAVETLAQRIEAALPGLTVWASVKESDPQTPLS